MKILTKTHVIYLKRKLRTSRIQIQVGRVQFVTKEMKTFEFDKRNSKGGGHTGKYEPNRGNWIKMRKLGERVIGQLFRL